MKIMYSGVFLLITVALQAMEQEVITPKQFSGAQLARLFGKKKVEDINKDLDNANYNVFSDAFKAFRNQKTDFAKQFICEQYHAVKDAKNHALLERYDQLLRDFMTSIAQIEQESALKARSVTSDYHEELEAKVARVKLDFLKRVLPKGENGERDHYIDELHEELRHSSDPAIRKEVEILMRRSPAVNRTQSASPSIPVSSKSKSRAYIKTNVPFGKGKGIVIIEPAMLQKFGKFWKHYNDGEGHSEDNPIVCGLERQDLLDLRVCLTKLEEESRGSLHDFLTGDLKVDCLKCARLISQAQHYGINELLEEFMDFFEDLIREKLEQEGFVATMKLLEEINKGGHLDAAVQSELSCRFFSDKDRKAFLVLLHTNLNTSDETDLDGERNWKNEYEWKPLTMGLGATFMSIRTTFRELSQGCLFNNPLARLCDVVLWDASERKELCSYQASKKVVEVIPCQTPFLIERGIDHVRLVNFLAPRSVMSDIPVGNSRITVSPNKEIVVILDESNLSLFNLLTGKQTIIYKRGEVRAKQRKAIFSADSSALLVACDEGLDFIDLLNPEAFTPHQPDRHHKASVKMVCSSRLGYFITADELDEISIWSKTGTFLGSIKYDGKILSCALAGNRFIGVKEGICEILEIDLARFQHQRNDNIELSRQAVSSDTISTARFSPDDEKVILISEQGIIQIFNCKTLLLEAILKADTRTSDAYFTSNGEHLLSVTDTGEITIWHYYDKRLSCTDSLKMVDAFLYHHCLSLLTANKRNVALVVDALLLGPVTGRDALLKLAEARFAIDSHALEEEQKEEACLSVQAAEIRYKYDEVPIMFKQAEKLMNDRNYEEAIDLFEKLVALEKDSNVPILAWSHLANCYASVKTAKKNEVRRRECLECFIGLAEKARVLERAESPINKAINSSSSGGNDNNAPAPGEPIQETVPQKNSAAGTIQAALVDADVKVTPARLQLPEIEAKIKTIYLRAEELRKAKRYEEATAILLNLDRMRKNGAQIPLSVLYRLGRWYSKGKGGLSKDMTQAKFYLDLATEKSDQAKQ